MRCLGTPTVTGVSPSEAWEVEVAEGHLGPVLSLPREGSVSLSHLPAGSTEETGSGLGQQGATTGDHWLSSFMTENATG